MAETFIKLSFTAIVPIIVSITIYFLEKKTNFKKLNFWIKQLIIGSVFGIVAVCGTEFGVSVNGATVNVRDAAVLSAGLIFGAPAGILAGIIGGVERWFAVLWGAGIYTRLACSISTVLAGFIGATLRKYMFDDKKPMWYYGLAIGTVTEILHMLMIFITNMSDVHTAFIFVKLCSLPMITLNGIAVMLAVLAVSIIGKEKIRITHEQKKISQTFQRWLLVCVAVAFCVTSIFTIVLQTQFSQNDTEKLLALNIKDVKAEISDASDENLLALTHTVAKEIQVNKNINSDYLTELANKYNIAEINIINESGIIIASTNSKFINYDMASGEQSDDFLVLLKDTTEYVQSYRPISYDKRISRKYAGVLLDGGGFVQVGYDAESFHTDIDTQVIGTTRNRHVGSEGCIIIANESNIVVSDRQGYEDQELISTGILIDTDTMAQGECFTAKVHGETCYCMYVVSEGYYIIAAIPQNEANFSRDISVYVTVFMEIIVFAAVFVMIYFLIKILVIENIQKINKSLAEITDGNLNVSVNVRTNEEFSSLSDDINSTVVTLKRYITEAAARIDKELEFAKAIQYSALPNVFPPYPDRTDFDIFAEMITAKEVGGDFYDFYMLGKDRLAFLIADVSGKGIPAAMFMMTSKTLIKSLAETGMDVNEVFTHTNEKLCENNDAGMFVTAWMGFLDLKTGLVSYANAGHNPPLVRHKNGSFEYLKTRGSFVLAGMEGTKYHKNELQLNEDDQIFLYTDGVTEATNAENQLYGEERLLKTLNSHKDETAEALCKIIKADVDKFVGDAPQFDDITMLCIRYNTKMQDMEQSI